MIHQWHGLKQLAIGHTVITLLYAMLNPVDGSLLRIMPQDFPLSIKVKMRPQEVQSSTTFNDWHRWSVRKLFTYFSTA